MAEETWEPQFVCLVCHTRVAKLDATGYPLFNHGTSWRGTGDHGSVALDGDETLELYLCDACLLLNRELVNAKDTWGGSHDPPRYAPWEPGADASRAFEECLRVYRALDGGFVVRGRLDATEADSGQNNLGVGATVKEALDDAFARDWCMRVERDRWRRERPAILTLVAEYVLHVGNERSAWFVALYGDEIAADGDATVRVEGVVTDGLVYKVRVYPTSPTTSFGDWAVPGAKIVFGAEPDERAPMRGTAVIQEERPEDVW